MRIQTTLDVAGMSCGSCVRHIEAALAPLAVVRVDVDLRKGKVTLQHDDAVPTAALIEAIEGAGYPVQRSR